MRPGWLQAKANSEPEEACHPGPRRLTLPCGLVSPAFPALCAVSLGLPFGVGWTIGGWHGALTALLWAGLDRRALACSRPPGPPPPRSGPAPGGTGTPGQ